MDGTKPRVERMYLEILLGMSQNKSLLQPLSDKEMAQWDLITKQVEEIRAKGGEFDIPNEIPNQNWKVDNGYRAFWLCSYSGNKI